MGEADTTEEAIMLATYRALCKHGYADLTMQSIADEFDKTKAVLHYHYDTKQKLLVAFLDYLLERFNRTIAVDEYDAPDEQLLAVIDEFLGRGEWPNPDEFDRADLTVALLQIRAQAPFNEEFRAQLTINFAAIEAMVRDILQDGIEQGIFRPVDPDRTATTIMACLNGARIYHETLDRDGLEDAVREGLHAIVHEWLCRPERE